MAEHAAIAGLVSNLTGVVLLFRYGMPYRVETKGQTFLIAQSIDHEEIRLEQYYRRLGVIGLILIVIGTALQIPALL